jgi:hypothetical protein
MSVKRNRRGQFSMTCFDSFIVLERCDPFMTIQMIHACILISERQLGARNSPFREIESCVCARLLHHHSWLEGQY